jgi:hypothetical protein
VRNITERQKLTDQLSESNATTEHLQRQLMTLREDYDFHLKKAVSAIETERQRSDGKCATDSRLYLVLFFDPLSLSLSLSLYLSI